jgi:hypothetical protein
MGTVLRWVHDRLRWVRVAAGLLVIVLVAATVFA